MPRIELTLSLTERRPEGLRALAGLEDPSPDACASQVVAEQLHHASRRTPAPGKQLTDE
jgi:hypothetical protein